MSGRPNILLILTDQHRFDCFGFEGHPDVSTPHLDELAASSSRFSAAYTPSPICGPARAALFTGKVPAENGIHDNWVPMPEGTALLSEELRRSGYHTGLVGKLHLSPVKDRHGFAWRRICDSPHAVYDPEEVVHNDYLPWAAKRMDITVEELAKRAGESEHLPPRDSRFWLGWSWAPDQAQLPQWTGDRALEFLESEVSGDAPFFLNVSFFGPHHPYALAEPWDSMFDPSTVSLPATLGQTPGGKLTGTRLPDLNEAQWRKMLATYYGHIAAIDFQIGRILKSLRKRGLWEETLIVFTSDHGEHMGDYSMLGKGTMRETSIRVPFLAKPPHAEPLARIDNRVISLINLYPTLLDYAGITGTNCSAHSLCPTLEGGENEISSPVLISMCKSGLEGNGQIALINGQWKTVGNITGGQLDTIELYDLEAAQPDSVDLAVFPEYHSILECGRQEIENLLVTGKAAFSTHPTR